jgi:hypothetical protein
MSKWRKNEIVLRGGEIQLIREENQKKNAVIDKWLSGPVCYENLSNFKYAALYVSSINSANFKCHIFTVIKPNMYKGRKLDWNARIKCHCVRSDSS